MKTFILALLLAGSLYANDTFSGFCEQGARTVVTNNQSGAPKVQGSFPQCTITVYISGTITLASIYSDDAGTPTPKANPFTASTTGYWTFYAADARYDVKFSGGGLPSPWTLGGKILYDPFAYLFPATGAVKRTVASRLNERLSVKDFGAVGDHIVNDTGALQAALTAACANDPAHGLAREVYFPAGRYNITGTLPTCNNLTLTGEGGERSAIIYYTGTGVAVDVASATFDKNMVTLKNLWLIGSDGAGSIGIQNSPDSSGDDFNLGLRLSNVFVQHFGKGIEMRNSLLVSIERSEFSNNQYGVYIAPVRAFTTISIADTRITNNSLGGMIVDDAVFAGPFQNSSLTVLGGNIEDNGSPQVLIGTHTFQVRIWGVHFESNIASTEINVTNSHGVEIENCYFSQNGTLGGNVIYSSGGAQNVLMSGLTIYTNGRTADVPSIKFEGRGNKQIVLQSSFLDGFTSILAENVAYINNEMSGSWDSTQTDPHTRKFYESGTVFGAAHAGDASSTSGFFGVGKRQNFLVRSEDISNASWAITNGTKGTCVGAAPDGTNTACTVTFNGADSGISQTPGTQTNGKLMTLSFWALALDTSSPRRIRGLFYDGGADSVDEFVTLSGTWKRYSFAHQFGPVNGAAQVKILAINATAFDFEIWGIQLSEGGLLGYTKTLGVSIDEAGGIWNENGFGKMRMTGVNNILDGTSSGTGTMIYKMGLTNEVALTPVPIIDFRNDFNSRVAQITPFNDSVLMAQFGAFRAEQLGAPLTGEGLEISYDHFNHWGAINAYDRTGAAPYPMSLQHTGGNVVIGNAGSADDGTNRLQVNGKIKTNSAFVFGTDVGLTQTIVVKGSAGANCNLVFKGGIVTSTTCP